MSPSLLRVGDVALRGALLGSGDVWRALLGPVGGDARPPLRGIILRGALLGPGEDWRALLGSGGGDARLPLLGVDLRGVLLGPGDAWRALLGPGGGDVRPPLAACSLAFSTSSWSISLVRAPSRRVLCATACIMSNLCLQSLRNSSAFLLLTGSWPSASGPAFFSFAPASSVTLPSASNLLESCSGGAGGGWPCCPAVAASGRLTCTLRCSARRIRALIFFTSFCAASSLSVGPGESFAG